MTSDPCLDIVIIDRPKRNIKNPFKNKFPVRKNRNFHFNTRVSPVELLKSIGVYPGFSGMGPMPKNLWSRFAAVMTTVLTGASFFMLITSFQAGGIY